MKAFAYSESPVKENDYGVSYGIIFAEDIEEAKKLVDFDNQDEMDKGICEIPIEKGYHLIGDYYE